MHIKIYGAGSIGNHLAHAASSLDWMVDVYDVDEKALNRMKNDIFPNRYGRWNDNIRLFNNSDMQKINYDYIVIGTPPDIHVKLLFEAIEENPKAILVEKPLCSPNNNEIEILTKIENSNIPIFVGYDHVVSKASNKITELLLNKEIGNILTIDVEFRENWKGIFKAHPWLSGPSDSYLGFWERGGGASGEHSHALNLWQYFAKISNIGKVEEIQGMLDYVNDNQTKYDRICLINLKTDKGILGRVVQDVITEPSKKLVSIQGTAGNITWFLNYEGTNDRVEIHKKEDHKKILNFEKTRPDDFIEELKHIKYSIDNKVDSPLNLKFGLETMKILNKLHKDG